MELLPFVDILKVFNNPINEEQAWAVCYQCAHFLQRNPSQEFYQDVYDSGINSIWLSRHGDVLLRKGPPDPNGSGKGPPHNIPSRHAHPTLSSTSSTSSTSSLSRTTTTPHHKGKGHLLATETDAVQALGTAIFEALDYGIDQSEERQLSSELEQLIMTMTNTTLDGSLDGDHDCDDTEAASSNGDDEGIEKDADIEQRCAVHDVIKMCVRHLSSKQDASHHYKAVCRALATEAGELFTFLDKVAAGKQQLSQAEDEDARRLEELQRADWACLWVQVMRSLRQGVRLKKVEHVHLPPLEYELTPFEMILEDIRSRRYTLTKIMVNGDIPHKVKNDAHAVILNFIRSRPPLKKVDERKLKPKPPSPPDPHELLLKEIRSRPKLRPVRDGKLVVEKPVQLTSKAIRAERSSGSSGEGDADDPPSGARTPARKVLKPDFNLLLNNSFEESSDDENISSNNNSPGTPEFRYPHHSHHPSYQQQQDKQNLQHLYPRSDSLTMTPPPRHSWQRAVTRDTLLRDSGQQQQIPSGRSRLQRRHTITVCEAPFDPQVLQELPVLQEEEEEQQASPIRDCPGSLAGASSVLAVGSSGKLFQVRPAVPPKPNRTNNDVKDIQTSTAMKSTASIVLRQNPSGTNPSLVRRASFEHRRSFSGQGAMGLSAIPEQEDDGKSTAQDSNQRSLARTRSEEQCPPPNPSPPCKGRAKAGLAMVGMKPSGIPYHPTTSYHASLHNRTNITTASIPATVTAPTPAPRSSVSQFPTHTASMQHAMSNSFPSGSHRNFQPQHASVTHYHSPMRSLSTSISTHSSSASSSSPSSPSPPSPVRSHLPGRSSSLDLGSSSQSPGYFKTSETEDSGPPDRLSRWRKPVARSHHTTHVQNTHISNTDTNSQSNRNLHYSSATSNSPRRWTSSLKEENKVDYNYMPNLEGDFNSMEYSRCLQDSDHVRSGRYSESLSEEEVRQKRLSLESGMSVYYEDALRQDYVDFRDEGNFEPGRRLSVGLDRGVRGRTGFRRLKTPEEEERVMRWRALQEDDRQTRLYRQQPQLDMEAEYGLSANQDSPQRSPRVTPTRRSGVSAIRPSLETSPSSQPKLGWKPENTDVLQQRMADEEARFERWRRLEEGTGSHPLLEHLNRHQECDSPTCSRRMLNASDTFDITGSRTSGVFRSASLPRQPSPMSQRKEHQSHLACPTDCLSSSDSDPISSVHDVLPLQKRWQNPVECLSLTLEEVTHIRSVLTKAELESLISHPDLYQQVAKNKLCFTCKTTRFALFGEWGTKCKFCKRTVCSKCLRKMHVPSDHFRNIPIYTLSPTPLTQEMADFIQNFIRGAPAPSVPATRQHSPDRQDTSHVIQATASISTSSSSSSSSSIPQPKEALGSGLNRSGFLSGPSKGLQRSQSAVVSGPKSKSSTATSLSGVIKGPMMAICCDCKGMVMEIIRATRASLTLISTQEGRASLMAPAQSSTSSTTLNHSAKQFLASRSKVITN